MASSFSSQISTIVYLISKLKPVSLLDIGKGFGKYGFLLHEYYGVDNSVRPNPAVSLRDQSRIVIDAVECNPDYLWPHLSQFYRHIFEGRIEEIYQDLPHYDLILMADVIEHLRKEEARAIVRHFVDRGSTLVVSTPKKYFEQKCFESEDERHLSHWTSTDFRALGCCDYQNTGAGRVFMVSPQPIDVRGFGSSPIKRIRRMVRALQDELTD